MFRFLLIYILLTQIAWANSGTFYSLIFGTSGVFWMIMYVPIEGLVYRFFKVKEPFKISFKINLFSALLGLLLMIPLTQIAWMESPVMVKHILLKYGAEKPAGFEDIYLTHFTGQFLVIIIYYLASIILENYRFKKKFPKCGLSLKHIIIANSITYAILLGIWQYKIVMPMKEIVKQYKAGTLKARSLPK